MTASRSRIDADIRDQIARLRAELSISTAERSRIERAIQGLEELLQRRAAASHIPPERKI